MYGTFVYKRLFNDGLTLLAYSLAHLLIRAFAQSLADWTDIWRNQFYPLWKFQQWKSLEKIPMVQSKWAIVRSIVLQKYNSQIMQRNPYEKQLPMPNIEHIFWCKIKHIWQCFSFLIDEKCGWKNDESLNQPEKKNWRRQTNKQTTTTNVLSTHKNITLMSTANSSNYES